MPIIGNVGRRSFKVRVLNITIHVVLILGALTMLYPFAIMVSGSFKSKVDSKVFSLYPSYFVDSDMLFRKYVEARNNEGTQALLINYKNLYNSYETVMPPVHPVRKCMDDWMNFLEERKDMYSEFDYQISEQSGNGVYPRNNRLFADILKKEADGSLENFNKTYESSILSWDEVNSKMGVIRHPFGRTFNGYQGGLLLRYKEFARSLPVWMRLYYSLDGDFIDREIKQAFGGDLVALNKKLGTDYAMWKNVHLARTAPEEPMREYWSHYVREMLNMKHIRVMPESIDSYRKFLKGVHKNIDSLNAVYATNYSSFKSIQLPKDEELKGGLLADWSVFIEATVDAKYLLVTGLDLDYGEYLKREYNGDLGALNKAHKTSFATFEDVPLLDKAPTANLKLLADWKDFVRGSVDVKNVIITATAQSDLVEYLSILYPDAEGKLDLKAANKALGTSFKKVINVYPAKRVPANETYNQLWVTFMKEVVDVRHLAVDVNPKIVAD